MARGPARELFFSPALGAEGLDGGHPSTPTAVDIV
jgi:hypothetical protein